MHTITNSQLPSNEATAEISAGEQVEATIEATKPEVRVVEPQSATKATKTKKAKKAKKAEPAKKAHRQITGRTNLTPEEREARRTEIREIIRATEAAHAQAKAKNSTPPDPEVIQRRREEREAREAASPYRHAATALAKLSADTPEQLMRLMARQLVRDGLDHNSDIGEVLYRYFQTVDELSYEKREKFRDELSYELQRLRALDAMGMSSPGERPKVRQAWLVPGLVPAAQIGILHGSKNDLKTSLTLDLAMSIATGTAFAGYFDVPQAVRCGVIHAEDSTDHADSILARIAAARGLQLAALRDDDRLVTTSDVPKIQDPAWLRHTVELVTICQIGFLVLEGGYLGLGGADQRLLLAMGSALSPIKELCDATGVGPFLTCHNKQAAANGWPSLRDVSGVGPEEIARFWMSLNRKSWDPSTGHHQLRLVTGNKLGEERYWLDVVEGREVDPGGRVWRVAVRPAGERPTDSEVASPTKAAVQEETDEQRVTRFLADHPDAQTANAIAKGAGLSRRQAAQAIASLVDRQEVEPCQGAAGNAKAAPYKRFRLAVK